MTFRDRDGQVIERDIASVYMAIDGGPAGDVVVMAEPNEVEVIGEHTIQAFGMTVDWEQKKLVPAVMWALASITPSATKVLNIG